ncbi:MAG: undecaprenyl-diphosphate phosphatase [Planctomycetaceae bacterium]|jgi:undecaprenyl-diphosphatase|nr:undecaprenyl-diphosphate phosphatase [Planctomycetaceae bacterium]
MVQFIEIIIIAVVQGIGEFLPISSSGHLVVTDRLFEMFGQPLTGTDADFIKLEVALHVGTLITVLVLFWRRIYDMLVRDWVLIGKIILATLPAVAAGLVVKKLAPWIADDMHITATGFLITAILLLITLKFAKGEKTCGTMTWKDALFIGCVQAVAIIPGLSRSGSTIVAALFCKLRRDEAAAFSFLMSIPVIAGGGILEAKDLLKGTEGTLPNDLLLVGLLTACGTGFVSLLWIINWLKQGKLWYFALWLFVMCPLTFYLAGVGGQKIDEGKLARDKENAPSVSLQKAIEDNDDSELTKGNLDKETAEKEYQKILAGEEAKEKALIEEEQKRIPFVDNPEKLVLLDPKDRIWLTPDGKSVVLLGRVSLREGLLELFACRVGSKEHESVVSIRVKPHLIHAALLAIGAEPGKPVQQDPFVPPSGDEIEVKVRWKDETGKQQETFAQEWVWDAARSKEDAKKPMTTHWVFTGSMQYKDEEGEVHYVADETGELFGVSNFVGAVLDVPVRSSADNADLQFSCFTERIPPLATPLTLILTPVKSGW